MSTRHTLSPEDILQEQFELHPPLQDHPDILQIYHSHLERKKNLGPGGRTDETPQKMTRSHGKDLDMHETKEDIKSSKRIEKIRKKKKKKKKAHGKVALVLNTRRELERKEKENKAIKQAYNVLINETT